MAGGKGVRVAGAQDPLQAAYRSEPHIIAAAQDPMTHLATTGENTPGDSGMVMTLAQPADKAAGSRRIRRCC